MEHRIRNRNGRPKGSSQAVRFRGITRSELPRAPLADDPTADCCPCVLHPSLFPPLCCVSLGTTRRRSNGGQFASELRPWIPGSITEYNRKEGLLEISPVCLLGLSDNHNRRHPSLASNLIRAQDPCGLLTFVFSRFFDTSAIIRNIHSSQRPRYLLTS